jgi:hypothetical protein
MLTALASSLALAVFGVVWFAFLATLVTIRCKDDDESL